jgi:hypothetical protein
MSSSPSSVLSISDDDLPLCQPFFGSDGELMMRSTSVSAVGQLTDGIDESNTSDEDWSDESDGSSDSDHRTELELDSVLKLHPEVKDSLKESNCDVDMIVFHDYDVRKLSEDFFCSNVVLEPRIHMHRGFTETAQSTLQLSAHAFVSKKTDLFLGTIGSYQIIVEGITGMIHYEHFFFGYVTYELFDRTPKRFSQGPLCERTGQDKKILPRPCFEKSSQRHCCSEGLHCHNSCVY